MFQQSEKITTADKIRLLVAPQYGYSIEWKIGENGETTENGYYQH